MYLNHCIADVADYRFRESRGCSGLGRRSYGTSTLIKKTFCMVFLSMCPIYKGSKFGHNF